MESAVETISWLFVAINSGRVLSYLPQIYAAFAARDGARSISLLTWSYFTFAHATGAAYSLTVIHDAKLGSLFVGNAIACAALVAVVAWKRWVVRRPNEMDARMPVAVLR